MKTFNGKSITKKQIVSVIRTQDSTQIYRLYYQVYGIKPVDVEVCKFIQQFAPTDKLYKAAYNIACRSGRKFRPTVELNEHCTYIEWKNANIRQITMQQLRREIARGVDGYTKRPIMGKTNLYFASPVYGHHDYNKSIAMPISGNERFCELICRLADKYLQRD